ncbi:TolC family protein [Pseudochelatococcus sp. G4_1912]|uniref:TolC family protein n=1 Tax=Pseudochelatococcus sp. G4_1912 TaxID=3114288 RepID=UPI0039C671C2
MKYALGSGLRRLRLSTMAVLACLALTACATDAMKLAPTAPDQPWKPGNQQTTGGAVDFSLPADPALSQLHDNVTIDTKRSYGLAELIDIAQRGNPATRIAWEHARQAALAVGMVEATYLPMITANVIGGRQKASTPVDLPIAGERQLNATLSGVSPSLALQWLLFDFGQRQAVAGAAREVSYAANVMFNASHQKLIFDVANAYYLYGAATSALDIAHHTLRNSREIRSAVEARLANGRATTVEVAQARQLVAQSELRLVKAEGQARDAYQAVLAAMGINATVKIKINGATKRNLPAKVDATTDNMIKAALSRRPDVIASYAALKASQSGIAAAEAEFMPKVFVAGGVTKSSTGFNASGLPTIGNQATGMGFLVGATMPIYDSGLRAAQLKNAQAQASASEQVFRKTQLAAVTEIVVASNALRTALESHKAATALLKAAAITYDAAIDAYKNGVGTLTVVTEANSGLLDARLAQADAHAASLITAANLAFMTGSLTSTNSLPFLPVQ